MPIALTCTCGKQFNAKDEFAGKRIRCPACGTIVAIPYPLAETNPETAGPQPPVLQVSANYHVTKWKSAMILEQGFGALGFLLFFLCRIIWAYNEVSRKISMIAPPPTHTGLDGLDVVNMMASFLLLGAPAVWLYCLHKGRQAGWRHSRETRTQLRTRGIATKVCPGCRGGGQRKWTNKMCTVCFGYGFVLPTGMPWVRRAPSK